MDEINQFLDFVDTPVEGLKPSEKREKLKEVINRGKAHLFPGETLWTLNKIDKSSDKVVEKLFAEYEQAQIKYKAEKTGEAVTAHMTNLYANTISKLVSIDSVDKLRKDITDDPIIRDSMADVGAILVGTFGKLLAPILLGCHTLNHVEISADKIAELSSSESQELKSSG
jgi:hypothetical protein